MLRISYFFSTIAILAFCLQTGIISNALGMEPASWLSFQNGGHVSVEGALLATNWSPEKNIAWQTKIEGYGQSSPVVKKGIVAVTSVSGDNKEKYHLAAFDLESGKKLWQQNFDNPSPQENTSYVSRAAPTPVSNENGFIAFFEGGLVVALTDEGKVLWHRDLIKDYGAVAARHGLASSLEQNSEHVFVWVERSEDPYVLALDKESGKTVWKSAGLGATSWSSPRLVPTPHGEQLVLSAGGMLAGFDPASGKRLWEFDGISNNTSCSPMPVGDGRFLIGASDGRGEERSGRGAVSNGLIQISKQKDGSFTADFVWHAQKASSSFGSPVSDGKHVYIVNRSGVLFTLDLESGKRTATTRVASGSVWATPLVVGEHLYLFGNRGTTSVLSVNSGKELARNETWEPDVGGADAAEEESTSSGSVLYAAIPAPPYLLIRRGDAMYAVKAGTQ